MARTGHNTVGDPGWVHQRGGQRGEACVQGTGEPVQALLRRGHGGAQIGHLRQAGHVERPGQKKILIGAAGSMMKRIGMAARKRIEDLVGEKVVLRLWVRVTPDWRESVARLDEFGYGKSGPLTATTMIVAEAPSDREEAETADIHEDNALDEEENDLEDENDAGEDVDQNDDLDDADEEEAN